MPEGLQYDVVIVGGGAAGIATAASILRRAAHLSLAIVEPADTHYYQPGWTMVGAGIFPAHATARAMASVMPKLADLDQSLGNGTRSQQQCLRPQ